MLRGFSHLHPLKSLKETVEVRRMFHLSPRNALEERHAYFLTLKSLSLVRGGVHLKFFDMQSTDHSGYERGREEDRVTVRVAGPIASIAEKIREARRGAPEGAEERSTPPDIEYTIDGVPSAQGDVLLCRPLGEPGVYKRQGGSLLGRASASSSAAPAEGLYQRICVADTNPIAGVRDIFHSDAERGTLSKDLPTLINGATPQQANTLRNWARSIVAVPAVQLRTWDGKLRAAVDAERRAVVEAGQSPAPLSGNDSEVEAAMVRQAVEASLI